MAARSLQRCLSPKLLKVESAVIFLLLQLSTIVSVSTLTYDHFEVTHDPSSDLVPLQRMVRDKATGSIYVGSVNRIYKLSSNLLLEMENVTGPKQDNQECRPPPNECLAGRTSTNNINKVLVVDEEGNQLITCGSIYQGFCQVRRLDDLSIAEDSVREVGTNTQAGTNVAFIAPGPTGSGNLLYTAASRAAWIRDVPTVAKRVLDTDSSSGRSKFFPVAGIQIPGNTIDESAAGNYFDINYMYGFSSGDFSYFIATQLENFRAVGSPLYTKIVRLCQEESSQEMNSYIELPLVCKTSNGVVHNLAKSAYVTNVGSDLYDANITQGEDVLFVTFSGDDSVTEKSIICMYPVRTINERFAERMRDCASQGTDATEIDWLLTSSCVMSQGLINLIDAEGSNYCHLSDVNTPLGGLKLPIKAQAIYSCNSSITAIAATPHNEATVLLLGDKQGNLRKLRVESRNEAQLYEELPIVSGSQVVQNGLMFDTDGLDKTYVYFMTERKTVVDDKETYDPSKVLEEPLCLLLAGDNHQAMAECSGGTSSTGEGRPDDQGMQLQLERVSDDPEILAPFPAAEDHRETTSSDDIGPYAKEAGIYLPQALRSGRTKLSTANLKIYEIGILPFYQKDHITKVPIETCETLTTCEDCLSAGGNGGDPHCGWCPLQTSCTRRSEDECRGASGNSSTYRWIGSKENCIAVQSVTPSSIPIGTVDHLTLEVTSLPTLNRSLANYYECVFGHLGSTRANMETFSSGISSIQCSTPANVPMPQGGVLSVPLSIRTSETGNLIVNTTFDFYNCSAFQSCTECVANDYTCNWCIFENRCMGDTSSCNSTGVVAGRQVQNVNNAKRGSNFCPRIANNTELLIPAGLPEPFSFIVEVGSLPVESGYECVLKHDDWKEEVTTEAMKLSDTRLNCFARKYNYSMDENEVIADFSIRWNNGQFLLDNPFKISVTLYKCAVKRTDCGQCLLADSKFSCGWCEQSAVCTMMSRCPVGQSEGNRWLSGPDLCPDPRINSFYPTSGHIAGGARITIRGFNLGQAVTDITNVTVAGVRCDIRENEYKAPERIVCRLAASEGTRSGPVRVMIRRGNETTMTTSQQEFSYVVPGITSFRPLLGPAAGGSKVMLRGEHLNAGSTRNITVAGVPCDIIEPENSSSDVSCITGSSFAGEEAPVVMTFDMMGTAISMSNFSYTEDPTIQEDELSRTSSILSGGLDMVVMGTYLDVIQEPMMVFRIETRPQSIRAKRQTSQLTMIMTPCSVTNSQTMTCKTPNLNKTELRAALPFDNSTMPPSFVLPKTSFSFVLDALVIDSPSDLRIYVNPEYFKFEEADHVRKVDVNERKIIVIKGRYIQPTFKPDDVTVRVGNMSCEPVMQKGNNISCEAPVGVPGQTFKVVVHHGNLVVPVGYLEYQPEQLALSIIIGAAAGGVVIILIILFAVCICRRISANERRFKKMEQQRDEMEMRVAQECKDAFAELQITVLTVSSDVEGSGIPFRDYRDYAARILFPDNPHHPVFREIPVVKENISGIKRDILQRGLVQFGNLISNHTFLAIFIRTLEAQKTLTLRDFSNVASLLIIALHNKMDFLTEAMKNLLQELIKSYVKESRPHLLLRRSEAVVEKLVSHWLSILMYDSLKDSMGKPLFHLFYAIKQQIDKGPVDAMTGEARYGLSEMKVIRQQIDFKTLNIFTNALDITSEPIQLRVLDCDTISQTKDKILDAIYKSCPFSKRPTKDELDLEWTDRPGGTGSMILLDDDGRGRMDGEWKRINTLAYYQVPDGATLRLVRAQANGGSLPSTPARKYGTLQTSPATSASPIMDQERGANLWHLVKHVDSGSLRKGERDQKMMAEIYLPRLLTTKGILQQFVDELLETIFNCDKYDSDVPLIVKYLFDFFEEQAREHSISNPDVLHAWKSNCLQLRFWVNLIMNPTILFDINKTDTVDACVSIIGQTLIDSCSVSEQNLTKDSPSNKLLYAKDIPTYKQWVARYYSDISEMAAVSDQDLSAMLTAHTNRYQNEFQPLNALNELYFCYACIYKSEILQALDEDKEALKQNLGDKLEDIFRLMADSA